MESAAEFFPRRFDDYHLQIPGFCKDAPRVYTFAMPSEESIRIEAVLKSIPRGKVSTYGRVAELAGLRNGARQVARLLHSRASTAGLPWQRVLRKDGSIALPAGAGLEEQSALLKEEGVAVSRSGRVDLARYGWK